MLNLCALKLENLNKDKWESELFSMFAECTFFSLLSSIIWRLYVVAIAIMLIKQDVILGEHHNDRNIYFNEISGIWKVVMPITHVV